ncbi:MAG: 2-hydroxyacyl-CoA dehydratase [Actinomycetota bacterium]|jgi:benzoyl-CoA reductase subunit C|nr:2-hydroxyacyl-CoA dehydratase [Actinomycetota bacterium]MDA8310346.1 2-hydroxyacyl-CoA dehydratase [Actinomycetota bacterium]
MPRVLDPYEAMSLAEAIAMCRDLVEDPDFPTVARWRDSGGKVVGHFQVYFPEEIVHAAGLLPFKVRGAPLEARQGESHFGSYLCSILKTSLEIALTNRLALDMFVSHPICDSARNLAAVWGRNFDYPCEILYLPQNANSAHAATYLRGEYARLSREVEAIAGHPITADELRASLGVFNENRRLLRELYEIKRETPWLLAVDEAYSLVAVGGMVPREEHNQLLRWALPRIRERSAIPQDRMRLVFAGGFCEQPPLDLLRTIAQFSYVVDDDLLIGLRWITEDIPVGGDPLADLAEAYLERSSYSPVQHDLRKPKEQMLLAQIKGANAGAAIITAAKMCEPGLDEVVAYTKALDDEGIPYFVSEFEERMTNFDSLQIQLETFIENLLFA